MSVLLLCSANVAIHQVKPASYLHLQVDGPLSVKCYIQALEICYIRLCHKAELRTALSIPNPRHPHAPQCQLDASYDPASRPHPSSTSSSIVSEQCKAAQRQASTADLTSCMMPGATGVGSLAEATVGAPLPAASEAASGEAATPGGPVNCTERFGLDQVDYCCMHSPFHKLVRKAFARLSHIDHLRQQNPSSYQTTAPHEQVSSSNVLCLSATAESAGNPLLVVQLLISKIVQYRNACNVVMHACRTYHVPDLIMHNIIKHAKCLVACKVFPYKCC